MLEFSGFRVWGKRRVSDGVGLRNRGIIRIIAILISKVILRRRIEIRIIVIMGRNRRVQGLGL